VSSTRTIVRRGTLSRRITVRVSLGGESVTCGDLRSSGLLNECQPVRGKTRFAFAALEALGSLVSRTLLLCMFRSVAGTGTGATGAGPAPRRATSATAGATQGCNVLRRVELQFKRMPSRSCGRLWEDPPGKVAKGGKAPSPSGASGHKANDLDRLGKSQRPARTAKPPSSVRFRSAPLTCRKRLRALLRALFSFLEGGR